MGGTIPWARPWTVGVEKLSWEQTSKQASNQERKKAKSKKAWLHTFSLILPMGVTSWYLDFLTIMDYNQEGWAKINSFSPELLSVRVFHHSHRNEPRIAATCILRISSLPDTWHKLRLLHSKPFRLFPCQSSVRLHFLALALGQLSESNDTMYMQIFHCLWSSPLWLCMTGVCSPDLLLFSYISALDTLWSQVSPHNILKSLQFTLLLIKQFSLPLFPPFLIIVL